MRMYCIFAAIIAVSLADVSLSAESPGQSAAGALRFNPISVIAGGLRSGSTEWEDRWASSSRSRQPSNRYPTCR